MTSVIQHSNVLDTDLVRGCFPILTRQINDQPLVYLDNAATALKPDAVLSAESSYYRQIGGNVHRGRHALSEEASDSFERSRATLARFLGALSSEEIVFTPNATAAMNIVAEGLSLSPDDEIITTSAEHHSTILPWMARAKLKVAPIPYNQPLDPDTVRALITRRTRALVLAHASNVTGLVQPVAELCHVAREANILSVVDAAQSAPHMPLDVRQLDCDFLVLSGHKMLGPTGTGLLYGRCEALDRLEPKRLGGGVVTAVSTSGFRLREGPARFEPGTPNIAGAMGLAAAAQFLQELGWDAVQHHARTLASVLYEELQSIRGTRVLRPNGPSLPLASITVPQLPLSLDELAVTLSDNYGVMVRAGLQCAHPLFQSLDLPAGALRASAYVYNTVDEVRYFCRSLGELLRQLL